MIGYVVSPPLQADMMPDGRRNKITSICLRCDPSIMLLRYTKEVVISTGVSWRGLHIDWCNRRGRRCRRADATLWGEKPFILQKGVPIIVVCRD